MKERIAKLEGRSNASLSYFISDEPEGMAKPFERYPIDRELSVEEWTAGYAKIVGEPTSKSEVAPTTKHLV